MKELQKRVWAEISLGHIEHNLAQLRRWVPEGCRCMGVVKADAYGHGSTQVAHTLEQAGAEIAGLGTVIAKAFQPGMQKLRDAGYRVEALAAVSRMAENYIEFE